MRPLLALLCLAALAIPLERADACTSIIVGKSASVDGSTMVTYAADAHNFYGDLRFTPARTHKKGAMREIIEWDTGKRLGVIPEVPKTFKVIGNMNERQLVIGETTFGGREALKGPAGLIDYGSLIFIALERASSAREAIRVMGDLLKTYGYASEGESFSIADPNETWIMELIGKGAGATGAVWMARRIPDGAISAHANQARIRECPLKDPENCLYSPDVIEFARQKGWHTGPDEEFSFAEAYSPLDWKTLRSCELRVWNVFRRAAPSSPPSLDWVKGVKGAKPLPLWIIPDKKQTAQDVMALMRDHYEGTEFDMTRDVGAGPYHVPYRWRPMHWKVDGKEYVHERAISTQQTGFSFVSQSRASLPDPVGGLLWFGVDDTYSTVYVPLYAGMDRAPKSYAQGTGAFDKFTWDAAFWVFNWVSNQAYTRYDAKIFDIQKVQRELESRFAADQAGIEAKAVALFKSSPAKATKFLTDYSTAQADGTVRRWRELGEALFMKYLDGNVRDDKGVAKHPPHPESWLKSIAAEHGEMILVREIQK